MWTLDELLDRVRTALAEAEYPGAPNGRVREVPDRRAVRWYATTGLVDRPVGMRGRNALYGPRHLLQLVAVKRRQAEGHSLARIQAELSGATDATLAAVARVPDRLLAAGDAAVGPAAPRTRFWAAPPPMAAAVTAVESPSTTAAVTAVESPSTRAAVTAVEPPSATASAQTAESPPGSAAVTAAATFAAPEPATVATDANPNGAVATLAGVPLPGGAVLLLPAHPDPDDLAAIHAAAQPLLDLLADRGLLTNP